MSIQPIAVGDTVRVSSGQYQGKTGTVLRIIRAGETFMPHEMALVKFTGGGADYCQLSVLKRIAGKEDKPEGAGEGNQG